GKIATDANMADVERRGSSVRKFHNLRRAGRSQYPRSKCKLCDGKSNYRPSTARTTAGKFETRNARVPIEAACGLHVFLRVPKGAVIHRIDGHGAVIAPTGQAAGLGTSSVDNRGFRLQRPGGSLGTRPVKNTDGRTLPLETLYPRAISPA